MKKEVFDEIKGKLSSIKKLTKEIDLLMSKGNRFIIRATMSRDLEYGLVDIYDPVNMNTSLVDKFKLSEDLSEDFITLCRGIYQAIKAIPISKVAPGSFDLKISHLDDWDPKYLSNEDLGEKASSVRTEMLAIFEQYGVKPNLLFSDETEEMEEEYDSVHID